MIIDCHAHAYPDEVAAKLVPKIKQIYGVDPKHDATVAGLKDSMKQAGIEKSFLLTVANRAEHVESSNNWCIKIQETNDDLICFGSVHPEYPNFLDELQRLADNGIWGIKLQPNAQRFYPDTEELFLIYQKLSDLGMALVFHIGDEVKPVEELFAHPKNFSSILDSFPDLTILLAHLGGYKTYDSLNHVLDYANVWYDTAFVPGNIADEKFIEIVSEIGVDKVVFGTDFPWADPAHERGEIERIFADEASLILERNPERFLSIVYP